MDVKQLETLKKEYIKLYNTIDHGSTLTKYDKTRQELKDMEKKMINIILYS